MTIQRSRISIQLDFDKTCQECEAKGAAKNGLCMDCNTKLVKEYAHSPTDKPQQTSDDMAIMSYQAVEYGEGFLDVLEPITLEDAIGFAENVLGRISKSIQLWWGDFLNWSEAFYGEEYAQIVPEGFSTSSILRWKWVCNKVPISIRRRMKHLDYSHYEILSGLDTLEKIEEKAQMAEDEKMSTRELKKLIKPTKQASKKEIECPKCGHMFEG